MSSEDNTYSESKVKEYTARLNALLENPEILDLAKTELRRLIDEGLPPFTITQHPQLIKEYKHD